jgi:hypothetical protein
MLSATPAPTRRNHCPAAIPRETAAPRILVVGLGARPHVDTDMRITSLDLVCHRPITFCRINFFIPRLLLQRLGERVIVLTLLPRADVTRESPHES